MVVEWSGRSLCPTLYYRLCYFNFGSQWLYSEVGDFYAPLCITVCAILILAASGCTVKWEIFLLHPVLPFLLFNFGSQWLYSEVKCRPNLRTEHRFTEGGKVKHFCRSIYSGYVKIKRQSYSELHPYYFFNTAPHPPVDQGLLIIEDSWSHSHTPQSVELLWTSDQLVAQTSTWQHTTIIRIGHPCPRRDSNPTIQADERPQTHVLDSVATGIGSCMSGLRNLLGIFFLTRK